MILMQNWRKNERTEEKKDGRIREGREDMRVGSRKLVFFHQQDCHHNRPAAYHNYQTDHQSYQLPPRLPQAPTEADRRGYNTSLATPSHFLSFVPLPSEEPNLSYPFLTSLTVPLPFPSSFNTTSSLLLLHFEPS
ncbi:hypothetical protein Pcinc_011719 [Petrolisthes cinctipes]|uniref:Uncharacterized protein n=1 Tax=Petrolisthes cinctipes TaxID=88211 RepID=A0AAE1G0C0_PETCI|nr:hypothetical protein Pcinc_011719 [Petrolisthes cinctipes]